MHPVTGWYLAEARHDDLTRALARAQLLGTERPERHALLERFIGRLHRSKPTSASREPLAAGCGLPMGCAA